MQGEMRTAIDRIMALETEKTTLQTNVEEKTVVVAQNSEELDAQKRQCKQLNEELDDMRRKMRKIQVCTLGVSPSLVSRYCEGYSCWST